MQTNEKSHNMKRGQYSTFLKWWQNYTNIKWNTAFVLFLLMHNIYETWNMHDTLGHVSTADKIKGKLFLNFGYMSSR